MSYKEAVEDNIRHIKTGNKDTWYFPLCCKCGEETLSLSYIRGDKYTCKKCKLEQKLTDKTDAEENIEAKERKYIKAKERVLKSAKPNENVKYEEAAEKIHKQLYRPGWFASTEEIATAIILVANNIKTRHQVKFGSRYRADFVLPDMKVVLEIDGVCYHNEFTKERETFRDSLIIAALGPGWEVIRIKDVILNSNPTMLVKAINKTLLERRKLREKNNGLLPVWYSDRPI
jgi:very-short-patch-repair endonuclease